MSCPKPSMDKSTGRKNSLHTQGLLKDMDKKNNRQFRNSLEKNEKATACCSATETVTSAKQLNHSRRAVQVSTGCEGPPHTPARAQTNTLAPPHTHKHARARSHLCTQKKGVAVVKRECGEDTRRWKALGSFQLADTQSDVACLGSSQSGSFFSF